MSYPSPIVVSERVQAPGERLDYSIDFADLLDSADSVTSAAWSVTGGGTMEPEPLVGTLARAWVSGVAEGAVVHLRCTATTVGGRVFVRVYRIRGPRGI